MQNATLQPQSQSHAPVHLRTQEYSMVPPADHPAPLSVTRAFVVQLRADTVVEQGALAGRVEHVVSGQATDFESLEALLAFMARVLRAVREHSAEP
jgi:hypothetical protein